MEDEIFHEDLARASYNELIEAIIVGLRNVMLPLKRTLINKILIDRKHAIHADVLAAIKAKNLVSAREAMQNDIKAVCLIADL